MTEIQGKSILVRGSVRFELARVQVIESRLYLHFPTNRKSHAKKKLSSEECFRLYEGFRNIKTPGNDGFSIEFYKAFWP